MPPNSQDQDVPIATIAKNRRDQYRVALATFKGHRGVDVRLYVGNGEGEHVPTPKGIKFNPNLVQALIDALTKARDAALAEGLIDVDRGRGNE